MAKRFASFVVTFAALLPAASASLGEVPTHRTLTFEDRVAAQRAIEEVYWRHRIWPKENPQPRPPLDAVMPEIAIRAKVEDYLKKSNALEKWWRRPITPEQLQAEMDRMTRQSHAPQTLREMFAALDDDPFLIAECVARPILVDRLIHDLYEQDPIPVRVQFQTSGRDASMGNVFGRQTWQSLGDKAGGRFASPMDERGETVDVVPRAAKEDFESWWASQRGTIDLQPQPLAHAWELAMPSAGGCQDDTWMAIAGMPDEREYHTAVWTGTEMLVWGGGLPHLNSSRGGLRYDPATDSWRAMNVSNAPSPRTLHTAVWTGSQMIVWGGDDGSYSLGTGGVYDPATDSWTATTAVDAPVAREQHTAVWTGTQMIVWGGFNGTSYLSSGGRYDATANSWTPTTSVGEPTARVSHAAVWTGSRMFIWGGSNSASPVLGDGALYDSGADTWEPITQSGAPSSRAGHVAAWTGAAVVVWGGYGSTQAQNDGARYDPMRDAWTPTNISNAPTPRSGASVVWTESELIVWGGWGQANVLDTGGRYRPATDTWTPISSIGAPTRRSSHTAVWTGDQMVVWGGSDGCDPTSTGGRYEPLSDTWTPTSTNGVPSSRSPTAVWTGVEMIVWGRVKTGGAAGAKYIPATDSWVSVNTQGISSAGPAVWTGTEMIVWGGIGGGRYNPSTDSWTPMTMQGAPATGAGPTAVWTGTKMILWGGAANGQGQDTGARYDPATDGWETTNTTGAPSPRLNHTAVWTGDSMIVWGGRSNNLAGNNAVLGSGGRYNPSTNSWLPVTSTDAPSARADHSAVWSGTQMIVWGGYNNGNLDTGARYDPASDTWTPTSTTAAPSPRAYHTAVWTGDEMIVWGGPPISTGARYNPATDSWTTMNTTNAPSWRYLHSAVWTGDEMIIWGGSEGPGPCGPIPQQSGARYCTCRRTSYYRDADGDGYGNLTAVISICNGTAPDGYVSKGGDCDDADAGTFPGAPQVCDGRHNDCSDPSWPTVPPNEADSDHDGYRICQRDCNDNNPSVHPGALETCNGIDDNCNGQVDEGFDVGAACTVGTGDCARTGITVCRADGTGTVCNATPDTPMTFYRDQDGDGYGDPADSVQACSAPAGYLSIAGDCNDNNALVHPGAPEVCNTIDDNCNGQVDEDAAGLDSDGDGAHNACDNCRFAYNPDQLDADGDRVGNACDNCIFVSNVDQVDTDSDGRGNACDNCPSAFNPSQDDTDHDGVGDVCDNCGLDYNPGQGDFDHDGEGDICDLNDGLILILLADGPNYIEWQQEQGYNAWNVYEGDLDVLKGTGVYTQAPGSNPLADRHCGETATYVDDFDNPPAGKAVFSLVTGVANGVEGSLGQDSRGMERPNANPCP